MGLLLLEMMTLANINSCSEKFNNKEYKSMIQFNQSMFNTIECLLQYYRVWTEKSPIK
jgi:hypothetical protein